jgi:DNA-binding NarL/FixJ family response regulator
VGRDAFARSAWDRIGATPCHAHVMKILLVDDHTLFRAGLRMLLAALGKDVVVIEASNADEAIAVAGDNVQLCLLDLALKTSDGIDLLARLKQTAPNLIVVIVSASDDAQTIRACIDAGAMSFIPKSASPEALTHALRQVLGGEVYLPDELSSASATAPRPHLTPRQRDVLRYLSQGLPTKLIARRLELSEHTVKEHIGSIFHALNVRNRTEAVICASRLALVGT